MKKTVTLAFQRWLEQKEKRIKILSKGSQVVSRWVHRVTWQMFDTWHQYNITQIRRYYSMTKVVVRLNLHCVAAAFHKWTAAVSGAHAARARVETQSRVKLRVVQKFRKKTAASAFSRWMEHALLRAGLIKSLIKSLISSRVQRFVLVALSNCVQ